jgi:hypothetical protein
MNGDNAAGGPEEREYRIYASEWGTRPVVVNIHGNEQLELAIRRVRGWLPDSIIYVREVFESVVRVEHPDGSGECFPPPDPTHPFNMSDGPGGK